MKRLDHSVDWLKTTKVFQPKKLLCLCLSIFLVWQAGNAWAADFATQSQWDKNLLLVDLGDVSINANDVVGAWREMTTKYLLRANLYMDAAAIFDKTPLVFQKENATGKDLLDAFLNAYPSFAYTQNPETGIIWIYPKRVNYNDILNQKIRVIHEAKGIPMYTDIYVPLCKLLAPNVIDEDDYPMRDMEVDPITRKPPIPQSWLYDVDLPSGDYSAREILDFCCVANPSKAFLISPESWQRRTLVIFLANLVYPNPLAPPRVEAIKFWELEIGKSTNGTPSLAEVRTAMSDPDPEKRSAAGLYVEASMLNYSPRYLIEKADGPDQTVWTAMGMENVSWRGAGTSFLTSRIRDFPGLSEDLKDIKNPNLALLASLQLTREKKDTSYLDAIVSKHVYTEQDIASIQPELERMARSSEAVRDKLKDMKSQVPELSPEALDEWANTNFLTLVPTGKN